MRDEVIDLSKLKDEDREPIQKIIIDNEDGDCRVIVSDGENDIMYVFEGEEYVFKQTNLGWRILDRVSDFFIEKQREFLESYIVKKEYDKPNKKEYGPYIVNKDPKLEGLNIEVKNDYLNKLQEAYDITKESRSVVFSNDIEMFPERDKRPPRDSWAPGTYLNTCCICKKNFMGDKRAVNCADCVYE